jgi:hypothetical protein
LHFLNRVRLSKQRVHFGIRPAERLLHHRDERVIAPLNCTTRSAPAAMVPRPVMVVVPLTMMLFDVAADRSTVAALAMVCVADQLRDPANA